MPTCLTTRLPKIFRHTVVNSVPLRPARPPDICSEYVDPCKVALLPLMDLSPTGIYKEALHVSQQWVVKVLRDGRSPGVSSLQKSWLSKVKNILLAVVMMDSMMVSNPETGLVSSVMSLK